MSNDLIDISSFATARAGSEALDCGVFHEAGSASALTVSSLPAAEFERSMRSAQNVQAYSGSAPAGVQSLNPNPLNPSVLRGQLPVPGQSATLEESISDHKVAESRAAKQHAVHLKHQAKHNQLVALLHKHDAKHAREIAQRIHDAHADATSKLQRLKEVS